MSKEITAPEGEHFHIKKGEPLKNMLNHQSLYASALIIRSVYDSFDVDGFLKTTMDETWDGLELKARGRKVTLSLGKYLPKDYGEALVVIDKVIECSKPIIGFSFTDFIEVYGQDDANWDLSMRALEKYTRFWSSEMAVRPFIINQEERMMAQMLAWSKHENEHVRRLASEGCRPALPWAQSLPKYKKDPSPIICILEQLKSDTSLYVRKSVANNLNDISKTHPDLVVKIAKDWYGKNEHTNWIVKHGCRTLLKKGNREVLAIFGLDNITSVDITDFILETKSILLGEDIVFSFAISTKESTKVRLEYGVDYVKSKGKRSRKIFQLSQVSLSANEKKLYTRKHSFADVSTRKHYQGTHSITLIVNGVERGTLNFELVMPKNRKDADFPESDESAILEKK
ncbi:DNA alkylation repair protein [Bacteroidales bacterium OttesenSCG-928-I21]|nr:DNA alkylation repair protein [Bacteroidales bacterium OttesenSCG-928-I21]